jgi:hypothetical protein
MEVGELAIEVLAVEPRPGEDSLNAGPLGALCQDLVDHRFAKALAIVS